MKAIVALLQPVRSLRPQACSVCKMDIFSVASTYLRNACERLRGGYSLSWRRDFSQLHFRHYECQSLEYVSAARASF